MQLEAINIGEYCLLDNEERAAYDFAISYSIQCEPRDILSFGDITKKTFGEVKDWQQRYTEPDYLDRFLKEFGLPCLELNVFDFFAFYKYVNGEIERVSDVESKLLSHAPSSEEITAGLERFNKFGVGIQIDNLAGGKVWMYEAVRALLYEDCLFKMVLDKTNNEFQRDLQNVYLNKK